MVKRTTIGKVQLLIGIIILLVGIGGIIFSYNWYKEADERWHLGLNNVGLEVVDTTNILAHSINMAITIIASSILSIFISLLFILQGLLNMSENK